MSPESAYDNDLTHDTAIFLAADDAYFLGVLPTGTSVLAIDAWEFCL